MNSISVSLFAIRKVFRFVSFNATHHRVRPVKCFRLQMERKISVEKIARFYVGWVHTHFQHQAALGRERETEVGKGRDEEGEKLKIKNFFFSSLLDRTTSRKTSLQRESFCSTELFLSFFFMEKTFFFRRMSKENEMTHR